MLWGECIHHVNFYWGDWITSKRKHSAQGQRDTAPVAALLAQTKRNCAGRVSVITMFVLAVVPIIGHALCGAARSVPTVTPFQFPLAMIAAPNFWSLEVVKAIWPRVGSGSQGWQVRWRTGTGADDGVGLRVAEAVGNLHRPACAHSFVHCLRPNLPTRFPAPKKSSLWTPQWM